MRIALSLVVGPLCAFFAYFDAPPVRSDETTIFNYRPENCGFAAPPGIVKARDGTILTLRAGASGKYSGVLCRFSPPVNAGDPWKVERIHMFDSEREGILPIAPLSMDTSGNFYGHLSDHTVQSKVKSRLYVLTPTPNAAKKWSFKIIYELPTSGDPYRLNGYVEIGKDGTIYTLKGGSLVFIKKFGSKYEYRYIRNNVDRSVVDFLINGITIDKDENLYALATTKTGTGYQGAIVKFTPPMRKYDPYSLWNGEVLYKFRGKEDGGNPDGRLWIDSDGSIFGITDKYGKYGSGTVYRLSPPMNNTKKWTMQVIHGFGADKDGADPSGGLTPDNNGNLVGVTNSGGAGDKYYNQSGTIYRIIRPKKGSNSWGYKLIYSFGNYKLGRAPYGNVVIGPKGEIYGATMAGGTLTYGTLYEYKE